LNNVADTRLKQVFAEIDRIAADNRSGAAEMIGRVSEVFALLESIASTIQKLDPQAAIRIVLDTCAALIKAQPDMAGLARLASLVAAQMSTDEQSQKRASTRDLFSQAALTARRFVEHAARAAARVAAIAAETIPEGASVLTHSRSSTVLSAFLEARRAGRSFSVIATESRPGLEGRALAEQLASHGIEVTLIADAAAGLIMKDADLLFFGADRITPQSVINKIGTRMLALLARESGLPCYTLSDTTKFINQSFDPIRADEQSGDEIWPDAPRGVKIINRYFEPTPLEYFTAILTEEGHLSAEEARTRAESFEIDTSLLDQSDS
jgi:translation initiation factor eIF-2B subunit delta